MIKHLIRSLCLPWIYASVDVAHRFESTATCCQQVSLPPSHCTEQEVTVIPKAITVVFSVNVVLFDLREMKKVNGDHCNC
jgi:hypothetical protein